MQTKNNGITKMPKLNKTMTITVDGDTIMKRVLELLPEDFKHREVLAHAIVGSGMESGNIGYIYNAISGFTNDIDFEFGNIVMCSELGAYEEYDANVYDEDGSKINPLIQFTPVDGYEPKRKYRRIELGKCKVVDINLYADNKLQVEFSTVDNYTGKKRKDMKWVNHKKCSFIEMPQVVGEIAG